LAVNGEIYNHKILRNSSRSLTTSITVADVLMSQKISDLAEKFDVAASASSYVPSSGSNEVDFSTWSNDCIPFAT